MLTHRLRRWSNIKPALVQWIVFAGILVYIIFKWGNFYSPWKRSRVNDSHLKMNENGKK